VREAGNRREPGRSLGAPLIDETQALARLSGRKCPQWPASACFFIFRIEIQGQNRLHPGSDKHIAKMMEIQGRPPSWLASLVLGIAVLIVSSAAIFIRFAQADGVSSMAIAAWRLSIAALVLTPVALLRHRNEITLMPVRTWALGALSGLFLAMHFAAWISSLAYTSIASSLALVSTNPVWIALASWLLFRERLAWSLLIGIAAAVGGSVLIFASDVDGSSASGITGSNPLLGNALAVFGSLTVCGYLLIGRRLRTTVSLLPYIWLVYTSAAVFLMASSFAAGVLLDGFSPVGWACLLALALGPQLLGHSAFNWALGHVSATFIAIVILGEPIGSALLAWLIFGERFAPMQFAGFALLLAGIYLASRGERAS
jgi:drug/metabolite transporter (DMT)-like permease